MAVLAANSCQALTPNTLSRLKWEFRCLTPQEHKEVADWHPATVPGVVQTDLLANKLIPDPFYGDNEYRLQWIGLADWEYRTVFPVDRSTLHHENVDLVFEGLDTYAEVYVNDQLALQADNMFRTWRIAAKPLLHEGDNQLRVVFRSPVTHMLPSVRALPYVLPSVSTVNFGNEEGIATAPYTRKAPYHYGWDWGPRLLTIGVWRDVRVETWNAIRLADVHVSQHHVSAQSAAVSVDLDVEASTDGDAKISVSGEHGIEASETRYLQRGWNKVSLPLCIEHPRLWWPNGYGDQNLYTFKASVQQGGSRDEKTVRTGLRSVELRRENDTWGKSFTFVVNGVPIFAKGANVIPFDSFLPRVTPAQHRKILESAKQAHMNMLRSWGGGAYESDDYYAAADELGIMVWQEFMFGGDMVPGDLAFQENVRQEALDNVRRLRNHPSIVLWCGNNEIETGWLNWADRQEFKQSITPAQRERVWQDYVVMFRDILKSVVEEEGGGVPYWPSSPGSNFEIMGESQVNGDVHYWAVWHALNPIADYLKQTPRFMSEYGFQSFPEMRTIASFAKPGEYDIRSVTMQAHQKNKGGNDRILTYMLREYPEPRDFASFVYLSQVLQAEAIKTAAENLRRNRPRTMGSLFWQINDCWPVASWSSIDYYGRWKALHYYAARFYNDVLVSAVRLPNGKIDVNVVSDRTQATPGTLRLRLMNFEGKVLLDESQAVTAPALSSAVYKSLDEKNLLTNADPHRHFLLADFSQDGRLISRNTLFFGPVKMLDLPVSPEIKTSWRGTSITLSSAMLARHVYLSFGDLDVQPSDNYFDLVPGEPVTIELQSAAKADQLKSALRITHVMQSFTPSAEVH